MYTDNLPVKNLLMYIKTKRKCQIQNEEYEQRKREKFCFATITG